MSESPEPTLPCSCPVAGWCERHQRVKGPKLHKRCQTREIFRAYWDAIARKTSFVPSISQQVANVGKAMRTWILAGRPKRSPEEIQRLYAICHACPQFLVEKDGVGRCKACGCWLKKNGGMLNKLLWKTENCPKKFW